MPTSERADLKLMGFDGKCTARSQRTGEQCRRPAARGANVCPVHGGAAPQVKAAARRRLDQAADVLVQRLLKFALDGDAPDHVALAAIRDALDRAGMGAKQAVEVEVKPPAPWEEVLGDVVHITKAQHEAMKRGEYAPAPQPALPTLADDIVDAEVVDGPVSHPERVGESADAHSVPDWAEHPPAPPSRELVTLEDAAAEVAQANRTAKVMRARRRR